MTGAEDRPHPLIVTGGGEALLDSIRLLVTREPSLSVVLAQVARLLTETLEADGCLVYRIEASGELIVAASHPPPVYVSEPLRMPAGFGVTGRVAVDAIPVVLVDDNPRNRRHRELLGLTDGQLVSRLCVPARNPAGGCSAVLAVHSRTHREFTASELVAVQRVADLVGLRVELTQVGERMVQYRQEWDGLVAATVAAQESERRRMAGDLHDGVTQAIASLTFHLSAAEVALGDGDLAYVSDQLQAARSLADVAFGEARSAITGLHSPVIDDLGLAAGLVSMARAVPNLHVEVDVQDFALAEHVGTSLFRIAQEAVQNVVKHAGADKAVVRLVKHGRSVVLSITDDGRGFEAPGQISDLPHGRPATSRYGLAGMAERVHLIGGRLSITSQLGEGTRVEVVVPISA